MNQRFWVSKEAWVMFDCTGELVYLMAIKRNYGMTISLICMSSLVLGQQNYLHYCNESKVLKSTDRQLEWQVVRRVQIAKYFRKIKLCIQRTCEVKKEKSGVQKSNQHPAGGSVGICKSMESKYGPHKNTDPPFSRKAHQCNPQRTRND